jgi:hypothetical protein
MLFCGYSKVFFCYVTYSTHMLEINVFIDSKVFGVTFGVNFVLPIVK